MHNPLLTTFRRAGFFMRTVTGTVLVTFTMLVLAPAAMAAQAEVKKAKQQALLSPTDEDELSQTVLTIDEKLKRVREKMAAHRSATSEKRELKELRQKVEGLDAKVMEHFDEVEKHIRDKKLDPVILQRQQEAVAKYKQDLATLLSNLKSSETAPNDTELKKRLDKAEEHLASRKLKRAQQPFDPNNLPNQNLGPTEAKPKKRTEDFTRAGLYDTPYQKYAALGDFKYDKLAGASDPAYLSENPEVKLTQAVKAQAAALNYDPVKIYHWVLNNVEWIPTWGATQDSDHTLSSRRGNSMDIASLTIALLRASGIPARYVHGTLEVPEDKFRNWAGGFDNVEAAANFASSGGIPTAGVVMGGKIAKVQLEHIWVEAAIDYFPSRGAVNREADTWVEMDPSYKQYQYLQGLDVASISGVDGATVAQQFAASGTVNDTEGWVQGLDSTILQNAQAQAQQSLKTAISQMTNPTVGDVLGGRKVIVPILPVLPSALMNRAVVRGARYGALPSQLQHKVTFALGYDPYSEINGTPVPQKTYPFAEVNNRKVTISFRPATSTDEQALASFLPEGQITDLSQLPTNIPAYLIKVVPELRIEGEVVSTGATSMPLGTDFEFRYATDVVSHGMRWYSSIIPAGSYYAVQVAGGSVSQTRVAQVKSKLETIKATLEANNPPLITGLTRDDVLGDMFYAGGLGYSAEYQAASRVAALQQHAIEEVAPSVGVYGYKPKVNYLFAGFPRSVSSGSVEMDLPGHKSYNAMLSGDRNKLIMFRLRLGLIGSALEHLVPEQMFVTQQNPGEAVSAVKAIAKAIQEGQRVYHLTQSNQDVALQYVHHDTATMGEINAAIAAGKEVVTHTDSINVPGWSGSGYIVFDPITGDGAFKITGGENGGMLAIFIGALLLVLGLYFFAAGIGILLVTYGAMSMFLGLIVYASNGGEFAIDAAAFLRIVLLAGGAMLVPFEAVATVLLAIAASVLAWIAFSFLHGAAIDTRRGIRYV